MKKTKIVCLCGSLRFKKLFGEKELLFINWGWIVLLPCCMYVDAERTDSFMEYKEQFDEMHKRKIDIADLVYVINPDGYIGDSTQSEILYATKNNKKVEYMEDFMKPTNHGSGPRFG